MSLIDLQLRCSSFQLMFEPKIQQAMITLGEWQRMGLAMFMITNVWQKYCIYLCGSWLSPSFPFPLIYCSELGVLDCTHKTAILDYLLKIIEKQSSGNQRQPTPFIQMQICFLIKRNTGKFTAKLIFPGDNILVKTPTSLQTNGMAAITKNCNISFTRCRLSEKVSSTTLCLFWKNWDNKCPCKCLECWHFKIEETIFWAFSAFLTKFPHLFDLQIC